LRLISGSSNPKGGAYIRECPKQHVLSPLRKCPNGFGDPARARNQAAQSTWISPAVLCLGLVRESFQVFGDRFLHVEVHAVTPKRFAQR